MAKLNSIVLFSQIISAAAGWKHLAGSQLGSVLTNNDLVMVAFVAPWTDTSRALEPEWTLASKQSRNSFISIDCTVDSEACDKYGVISYPAIRLFKEGEDAVRYRGPRKAAAMSAFVQRSMLPTITYLDQTNISNFKSIDDAVFVGYFPPKAEDLTSYFSALASQNHHQFSFGIVNGDGGVKLPSIVCYKGDGETEILSDISGLKAMQGFVKQASKPIIGELTRKNEMEYLKARKSLVYVFAPTDEERSAFKASLKALAIKYKEFLTFVTVDAVEYAHMPQSLGLTPGKYPALAVYNPSYGQVFPYDQRSKITSEAVEDFILDIVQGRQQPVGARASHTEL